MKKSTFYFFLPASFLFLQCKEAVSPEKTAVIDNAAQIKFNKAEIELGDITGLNTGYDFMFHNTGNAPLIISSAESSCQCVKAKWPKQAVLPGDSAAINVTLDLTGVEARFIRTLTVQSNAKDPIIVIKLSGEVKK